MGLLTIIVIAFGLAMDAFAVSISCGVQHEPLRIEKGVPLALLFGTFQAGMPVLGWLMGTGFHHYLVKIDHWVAFALLAYVGIKMIMDTKKPEREKRNNLTYPVMFILAVATSIDAFAVGLSFAFLNISILIPVLMIGVITFILTLIGFLLGSRLGCYMGKRFEFVGGLVLIGIGVKILIEHL